MTLSVLRGFNEEAYQEDLRKEGMLEEKRRCILAMQAKGLSNQEIADYLDLPLKEVVYISISSEIKNVIATMAISDMELDERFIWKLQKIAEGKLNPEDVRKEIIAEYKKGDG